MTPQISVILPTHDRLGLLKRSLASVLSQTLADIEVIVIDNACGDGSSEWLRSLSDPRLRILRLEQLLGASAARNAALKLAQAPLVAFQDDDDIWLPDKLTRQAEALQRAGAAASLCLCGYIGLTSSGVYSRHARAQFDEMDFDRGFAVRDWSLVATPGWLARRAALEQAGGFDEALPARNDWELALRLRDIGPLCFVDAPLYLQDQIHVSTMRKNEGAFAAALQRIEAAHGHRWAGDRDVQAAHAWFIGKGELLAGNDEEGRRWLRRAVAAAPLKPKPWALLLSSYLGLNRVRSLLSLKQRYDLSRSRRSS